MPRLDPPLSDLEGIGDFVARHIGISAEDEARMLRTIGTPSRRALIEAIVPAAIARQKPMELPEPLCEDPEGPTRPEESSGPRCRSGSEEQAPRINPSDSHSRCIEAAV